MLFFLGFSLPTEDLIVILWGFFPIINIIILCPRLIGNDSADLHQIFRYDRFLCELDCNFFYIDDVISVFEILIFFQF